MSPSAGRFAMSYFSASAGSKAQARPLGHWAGGAVAATAGCGAVVSACASAVCGTTAGSAARATIWPSAVVRAAPPVIVA